MNMHEQCMEIHENTCELLSVICIYGPLGGVKTSALCTMHPNQISQISSNLGNSLKIIKLQFYDAQAMIFESNSMNPELYS